jgi:hypothetical protein
MFTKIRTSMFAIAAVAALGAASLVTTTSSADARGFGGGGFHGGGMGGGHMMRMGGGVRMGHIGMRHVGVRTIRPIGIRPIRVVHRGNWCRFYGRCGIHVRWHRPWVVPVATAGLVATTYAVAPTVATAKPCTCLTKEYTPDNLVVFKDLCTKEVASAPAGNTQVQLQLPPQEQAAPQQQ